MITPESLAARFSVPGLRFDTGPGGLVRAVVDTPLTSGEIFLQGAHVTAWNPAGECAVLWMSSASYFERGKPIRGGVPICFPWFGPHPSNSSEPAHGRARITPWNLTAAFPINEGGVGLELENTFDPFQVKFRVEFGHDLQMSLQVTLSKFAMQPEKFEAALHTYFSVSEIAQVEITGLETSAYIDKVGEITRKPATGKAIRFESETDRVYLNTTADCILTDPLKHRKITVSKTGSDATVIWNPWIDKSVRMPDFGNDEWPGMLCIETANVSDNAIELQPGQTHVMSAQIRVDSLTD